MASHPQAAVRERPSLQDQRLERLHGRQPREQAVTPEVSSNSEPILSSNNRRAIHNMSHFSRNHVKLREGLTPQRCDPRSVARDVLIGVVDSLMKRAS